MTLAEMIAASNAPAVLVRRDLHRHPETAFLEYRTASRIAAYLDHLGFAVRTRKGDFIGRDAVLRKEEEGLKRRMVQFRLTDAEPLLFHNEALVRDGKIVSTITSGNYGHHLGGAIGMGYVPCAGESEADVLASSYEIEIAGVRVKAEAFVESAKVVGASTPRVMFRHVFRNSTRTLPLIFTLNSSEAILTLAGLGFLGFGIEPTSAAEWGYDLNRSISDVTSGIWWTSIFPGLAIVLIVLGITLIGESLNDLADPRLRARRRAGKGTPADAVAATAPVAREEMGEVL